MPLSAANRYLFGTSVAIFLTRFFPSMANLVILIMYSHYLPMDDYGNYQHFWIHLYIFYPLICLGIHVVMVTYSPGFIVSILRGLKVKHWLAYALWATVLSTVFAILQWNSINIVFAVSFAFVLIYSVTFIVESFLIITRRFVWLVATNMIYSGLFCVIHVYALSNSWSLQTLILSLLVITAARLAIYLVATAGKDRYDTSAQEEAPMRSVRSLWLHLAFYDISQSLFSYIDKFVISLVLTASLSAVYYNGSQNIPFIPLLLSAVGSAALMQLAAGKKEDETGEIISLQNHSGRLLSCVVFPLFFFLLFFRDELLVTLLSRKYVPAIPIFLVAVMVIPVRAYNFTTPLQRLHKGNIINAGALADLLLACALMYPFYQLWGLPGVALSFVVTTYLQAAFYLFYSARLLHVSAFKLIPLVNWLIKLIVFASLFITIHYMTEAYFSRDIGLILGGIVLVVAVAASLMIEISKTKNGSSATA